MEITNLISFTNRMKPQAQGSRYGYPVRVCFAHAQLAEDTRYSNVRAQLVDDTKICAITAFPFS